jgi:hypothetical protein
MCPGIGDRAIAAPRGRSWNGKIVPALEVERETGIEPATSTLARWRSTTELFPLGDAKNSRGACGNQEGRAPLKTAFPRPCAPQRSSATGSSSTVPPQCSQTRTDVPPYFFSSAQASQSGRPVPAQA